MKILTGCLKPTNGKAFLNGIDVNAHPVQTKKITGYLPESNPLYGDMYIREYLSFIAGIHQLPSKKEKVNGTIDQVGLRPEAGKKISQLSKGYKQRVGLAAALHEKKIANDAISPNYVVVGEGASTTDKLAKAHEHIERGARLVATNPDNWCPVSADKTRPGAGATTAFLEASTGRRAYYLGKPNAYMFYRARKKLSEGLHCQLGQTVMIGDTMATDIRGAIEIGLHAFLVMTGSTRLEEVGDYVYQPTRVLQSVADLVDEVRSGKVSDRLNSPAFGVSPTARARPGSRHQTDIYALYRPRPRPAMTK